MKRWIATVLLVIYLGLTTELYQLLKIPVLIEHFSEHQTLKNNLSFLNFLKIHYSEKNDHDGDAEKDRKLPFKSHSFCSNYAGFVFLISDQNIIFSVSTFFETRKSISNFYYFLVSSSHLQTIWQPPQYC